MVGDRAGNLSGSTPRDRRRSRKASVNSGSRSCTRYLAPSVDPHAT